MKKYDLNKEIDKGCAVMKEHGFLAYWSVYPCPKWGAKSRIKYIRYEGGWAEATCKVEVPVSGPFTWLDVYAACDTAIRRSGDYHHVFVEGFYPTDVPGVFELQTGS